MKKMFFLLMVGMLLASVMLVGCEEQQEQPISKIVAFGDGFSDNGNTTRIAHENIENMEFSIEDMEWYESFHWQGRVSNGPVAVEILADKLNVPLTDYAQIGAQSGFENNEFDQFYFPGLLGQIEQFKAELNGEEADPNALYFIHISDDDIYSLIDDHEGQMGEPGLMLMADNTADQVIDNIIEAITQLQKLGARRFMVVNPGDVSKMPRVIRNDGVDVAIEFHSRINSTLHGELEKLAKQLDIKINIFDYNAVNDRIQSKPEDYGIKNLTDVCWDFGDTVCQSPDEYYFWEESKPTRVVHKIMGEAMAEQLSK